MMNAKKMEKWLLLEQSGELSDRKRRILDACPEAKEKRAELKTLFDAVQPFEHEPSAWAATRIDARLRKERRSILLPVRVWKPILAAAACLTIIVATLDFTPESSVNSVADVAVGEVDAWSVQFEEDLAELEGLILAISDTSLNIMEM
jgi:ferric-dicitrate binding protein FerR (iron transport regulator)